MKDKTESVFDYSQYLLNNIANLKSFPSFAGSEGVAYFVNDDFVIKEYINVDNWELFDDIFDNYCKEMQAFANKGLSLSKIYAWTRMVNFNYYTGKCKNKYRYFILEERVQGRELYFGEVGDAFALVKDLCSKEEFKSIIKDSYLGGFRDSQLTLVDEILKRYFEDYVKMNEMLESMPEKDRVNFLTDAHEMYNVGKFLYPDLFPHNILVESGKLTMIDPMMADTNNGTNGVNGSMYVKDMVSLFIYNYMINKPRGSVQSRVLSNRQLSNLCERNTKVTKELITKIVHAIRDNCGDAFEFMTDEDKDYTEMVLRSIFQLQDAESVYEKCFE